MSPTKAPGSGAGRNTFDTSRPATDTSRLSAGSRDANAILTSTSPPVTRLASEDKAVIVRLPCAPAVPIAAVSRALTTADSCQHGAVTLARLRRTVCGFQGRIRFHGNPNPFTLAGRFRAALQRSTGLARRRRRLRRLAGRRRIGSGCRRTRPLSARQPVLRLPHEAVDDPPPGARGAACGGVLRANAVDGRQRPAGSGQLPGVVAASFTRCRATR